jgi:hypothetical protein
MGNMKKVPMYYISGMPFGVDGLHPIIGLGREGALSVVSLIGGSNYANF